jgi:hypothetical protein
VTGSIVPGKLSELISVHLLQGFTFQQHLTLEHTDFRPFIHGDQKAITVGNDLPLQDTTVSQQEQSSFRLQPGFSEQLERPTNRQQAGEKHPTAS